MNKDVNNDNSNPHVLSNAADETDPLVFIARNLRSWHFSSGGQGPRELAQAWLAAQPAADPESEPPDKTSETNKGISCVTACSFLILMTFGAEPAHALDSSSWNQWLGGPERRNSAVSSNPDRTAAPRFEELWRVPFGSGYSAVSVHGNSVVSLMNDGKSDYAVVLNAASGKERWRARLGRRYKGHDGSIDGPLSTPAVDDDAVYAISGRGRMFCLELATGRVRWEKKLKSDYGAQEPHYGFATSPLLTGDNVIVHAGGKGLLRTGNLVALDRRTGSTSWKIKSPLTTYASPAASTLLGIPQVISQAPTTLFAVREQDGSKLWEVPIQQAGSWTPMALPPDRVFLSSGNMALMIQLEKRGDRFEPKVLWQTLRLGGTINPIAIADGVIYGNHSRKLTAINAKNGELLWVERRDMFPLLVDGYLILLADREGKLVIARPGSDAYQQIYEKSIYEVKGNVRVESPMAFAGDVLYVRTDFALLALRIKLG